MSKTIWMFVILLGAQLNLTALVPAAAGQAAPPWWVGGGLLWPFFADTRTLLRGDALNTLTPVLGIAAAVFFLLAAAALMGWLGVPGSWFPLLVVAGAACSVVLQVIWLSGWAVLPLVVDAALLWAVLGMHATVASLRG
jgi:hypothetical protein